MVKDGAVRCVCGSTDVHLLEEEKKEEDLTEAYKCNSCGRKFSRNI